MEIDILSSLALHLTIILCAVALVVWGKVLRDRKSSAGISASSNDTSTGTTLIVCGGLMAITQVFKLFELFA
ncbi:hypothetical protein SNR37_002653 [Agarivorans aestuarii]|uniref:Uncharacterized protein n=1 Tax=Agarivorans aestuarii TaxID=1563703 RepID=A0ABU7G232_9ALTE|nr:hypothetical protein [Agarivorans aestuarii]MEE1673239.1 hypothetical protein [Agarivorans aestuarii]